jgi:apolipoprotein D and lipocalin family protein
MFCYRVIFVYALALLVSCGPVHRDPTVPMVPVAYLDPARYAGTWYEIARFPVPFQRGCMATTATYGVIDDRKLSVLNQCRDGALDGPLRSISGYAEILGPGQLRVRFTTVPLVRAPYWVLWIDEDYDTAVVGVPSGRAGLILARDTKIDAATRAHAEKILTTNGYDVSALVTVLH